jgi:hypothetical protein
MARSWCRRPRRNRPSVADGTAAALLDEAEDILNSVGDRIKAEVEAERRAAQRPRGLKRLFRRKRG